MVDLMIVVGTLVGSLGDPVFLAVLAVAAGLAFTRWYGRYYALAALAILAGSVRVSIAANNRTALGFPESSYTGHVFIATVVGVLLAYLIVAALKYLASDAGRPPEAR